MNNEAILNAIESLKKIEKPGASVPKMTLKEAKAAFCKLYEDLNEARPAFGKANKAQIVKALQAAKLHTYTIKLQRIVGPLMSAKYDILERLEGAHNNDRLAHFEEKLLIMREFCLGEIWGALKGENLARPSYEELLEGYAKKSVICALILSQPKPTEEELVAILKAELKPEAQPQAETIEEEKPEEEAQTSEETSAAQPQTEESLTVVKVGEFYEISYKHFEKSEKTTAENLAAFYYKIAQADRLEGLTISEVKVLDKVKLATAGELAAYKHFAKKREGEGVETGLDTLNLFEYQFSSKAGFCVTGYFDTQRKAQAYADRRGLSLEICTGENVPKMRVFINGIEITNERLLEALNVIKAFKFDKGATIYGLNEFGLTFAKLDFYAPGLLLLRAHISDKNKLK